MNDLPKVLIAGSLNAYDPLIKLLRTEGYEYHTERTFANTVKAVKKYEPEMIITDLHLVCGNSSTYRRIRKRDGPIDGIDVLKYCHDEAQCHPITIVYAEQFTVEQRVKAIKNGVEEMITQPNIRTLTRKVRMLSKQIEEQQPHYMLLGGTNYSGKSTLCRSLETVVRGTSEAWPLANQLIHIYKRFSTRAQRIDEIDTTTVVPRQEIDKEKRKEQLKQLQSDKQLVHWFKNDEEYFVPINDDGLKGAAELYHLPTNAKSVKTSLKQTPWMITPIADVNAIFQLWSLAVNQETPCTLNVIWPTKNVNLSRKYLLDQFLRAERSKITESDIEQVRALIGLDFNRGDLLFAVKKMNMRDTDDGQRLQKLYDSESELRILCKNIPVVVQHYMDNPSTTRRTIINTFRHGRTIKRPMTE